MNDAANSKAGMLRARTAANYLGLATSTLAKMRMRGDGPPYVKTARVVLYAQDDLDAWLVLRRCKSTSDYIGGER